MSEVIIVALISFAGTVVGSLIGVVSASKLTVYRIEQLEQKVDKHNKVIDRVYALEQVSAVREEEIKVANHRIDDLERKLG